MKMPSPNEIFWTVLLALVLLLGVASGLSACGGEVVVNAPPQADAQPAPVTAPAMPPVKHDDEHKENH